MDPFIWGSPPYAFSWQDVPLASLRLHIHVSISKSSEDTIPSNCVWLLRKPVWREVREPRIRPGDTRAGVAKAGFPGLKRPHVLGPPAQAVLAELAPAAGPGESSPKGSGAPRWESRAQCPCCARASGQM